MTNANVIDMVKMKFAKRQVEEYSIQEYLNLCKDDPMVYATAQERMLKAIGEPNMVDTSLDPRLSRIFLNKKINVYPVFSEFYGMEDTIEQIVSFFKHAAQGLEEQKQILYLLGPVGTAKSSLAEKLKELMTHFPIYVLKINEKALTAKELEWYKENNVPMISPIYESPLGLFDQQTYGDIFETEYNIKRRYLDVICSPWATKRFREFQGDLNKFSVARMWPSVLEQIAVTKTEPGDENNQDISSLVGGIDIRQLEFFNKDSTDAYSYKGGLNLANQGMLEFVEMFKAPIKILHPLLTATQEKNYKPTSGAAAIPFSGIVMAHSNESEWLAFRNNKNNEAFLDRVYIVKVPYCLRVTEEVNIYKKLLRKSELFDAPCAPYTLEMLAQFAMLTRLKEPENSELVTKMKVYDGENVKDTAPDAKSIQEYRDYAGVDEGMNGISTRFAFKILSKVFNFDSGEIAANPVHLLYVLKEQVTKEQFAPEVEENYMRFIAGVLAPTFRKKLEADLQRATIDSFNEYGQDVFERYLTMADAWLHEQDYRDPETGQLFDKDYLNSELVKIEKSAGISNPKDFRSECVNYNLRQKAQNGGKTINWQSYEKLRRVIEKRIFAQTEELLPVISFSPKKSKKEQHDHDNFVNRMKEQGYTEKQCKLLIDWYMRSSKNN